MSDTVYDVIIVGAGPGGIAVAAALKRRGLSNFTLLDCGDVGQAWLNYPTDTKLLSGSDPGHDDNMIADVPFQNVFPNIPHPSHILYQKYLQFIVDAQHLPVKKNVEVIDVLFNPDRKEFVVTSKTDERFLCKNLVWAAGMFTTPNEDLDAPGCYIHYAHMPYLADMDDPEITVVGSANGASGVVMQLAKPGRVVTLVTSHPYEIPLPIDCLWKEDMQFIKDMQLQGLVKFVENFRVKRIYDEADHFVLESEDGKKITSPTRPIICTGFLPNIGPIKDYVSQSCRGHETFIDLDKNHQSTIQPGLFVAGAIGKLEVDQGFIRFFRSFGDPIADAIKSAV